MNDAETLNPELLKQIEESELDSGQTEVMGIFEAIVLITITFIIFPLLGYLTY
ncbi:MAG: hypothetical protein IJD04_05385 [Desulfovibrionaceae bacterium]|nr:hypothetical protein [Desulfovibrionaceae bacterium]